MNPGFRSFGLAALSSLQLRTEIGLITGRRQRPKLPILQIRLPQILHRRLHEVRVGIAENGVYGVFGRRLGGDAIQDSSHIIHAILTHNRLDDGERPGVCIGRGFPGRFIQDVSYDARENSMWRS